MAQVVAFHGIGQQFKGDAVIHREWWPAFQSGLHLAGSDLRGEIQFSCPYYGHFFRIPGTLGREGDVDLAGLNAEESKMLIRFWDAAAIEEPEVLPSRKDYENAEYLTRTPALLQIALMALSRSRFWAGLSEEMIIGDVRQVVRFFEDQTLRKSILEVAHSAISPETRVVIGHSLGSVVAYEALCRDSRNVVSFVTLGSPLGIRNLIFDKLSSHPRSGKHGLWPGQIKYWTNIADKGDVVALEKKLAPLFSTRINDVLVYNGAKAHSAERYLTTREAGLASALGLDNTIRSTAHP